MALEWKRSTWVYSPVALGHTPQHLVNAIDTALLAAGWARASWSNGGALGADNYYLRTDRFRLDIRANLWGASGNQTITVVGANLAKTDIAGGGATAATGSVRGAGTVSLTGLPADGNTVTLTDGTLTKVFEFDNNGAVSGANIAVIIGTTRENCIENLASAVAASGINLVATPHWHWWYTGDNFYQHGGFYVRVNGATVDIASFIENQTQTATQISLNAQATTVITATLDATQVNNFLFIVGEDGFYIEGGTTTNFNNIAHGMVFAYYPDESLAGTRDKERTWTAQGCTYSLTGNLRSFDRNQRFVETVGDRRNHTGHIVGLVPRGSDSILNRTIVDNRNLRFGPRDHFFAAPSYVDGTGYPALQHTLGLLQSNFDDLYRVSNLAAMQGMDVYTFLRSSSGAEVVGAPNTTPYAFFDVRNALRIVPKFGVCSSYLLPWNNITDKRTGTIFRVARVVDGGRNSALAVVWPDNSNVTAIPATP